MEQEGLRQSSTWTLMLIFISIKFLSVAAREPHDVTVMHRLDGGIKIRRDNDEEIVTNETMGGNTELHSRTNAIGLPFLLRDGQIIDPSVGADVAACSTLKCPWTLSNWKLEKASEAFPVPPIQINANEHFVQETERDNITLSSTFNKTKTVEFEALGSTGSAAVYLLAQPGDIGSSDMYAVTISTSYEASLLKCTRSSCCSSYRIAGRRFARRCTSLSSTRVMLHGWEVNKPYVLKVTVEAGVISFTANRSGETLVSLVRVDRQPIDVKYITFGTLDVRGRFIFSEHGPEKLYALDGNSGTMKSPAFAPSSPKLCVSITSFISSDTEGTIELTAQDMAESTKISVGRIASQLDYSEDKWRTDRFVAEIPPQLQQAQLTLSVTASKQTQGHVLIQRIAGCNGEALEDIAVVSLDKPLKIFSDHGIDVALLEPVSKGLKDPEKIHCHHGGDYDEKEGFCLCPVGFTGKQCQQGCGPNRYGNDCGGVCSSTVNQCNNIIMCRPGLPCDCAPGIKGPTCSEECSSGEYGVGCKQSCGQCRDGDSCDKYTGVCHSGCDYTYAPPFCKETLRYLRTAPTVKTTSFYEASVLIDLRKENMMGEGDVLFYQLQYEKSQNKGWQELEPQNVPDNTTQPILQNIKNLKSGTSYDVRVLLICSGGGHSNESSLPVTSFVTQCLQPIAAEYNISSAFVTKEEFRLSWDFHIDNDTICPAVRYDVYRKINWQWILYEETKFPLTIVKNILPGSSHQVKVLAFTVKGPTRFSQVFSVTVQDGVPDHVVQLHADITSGNSGPRSAESQGVDITVMWQPPSETEGKIKHYILTYQCLDYVACRYRRCEHAGSVRVQKTSVVLSNMRPHAHYSFSVVAVSGEWGPPTTIYVTTRSAAPGTGAEPSSEAVTNLTNSSFVAHWKEPADCTKLYGYMYGYHYQLLADNYSTVYEGLTDNTHVAFSQLLPHTDYQLRVQLVTSHGYDTLHSLLINATTKSSVPGPVRQLVVYKRSRKVLGIRWMAPIHVSGTLDSFKLSYNMNDSVSEDTSLVLEATPCPAWPDAFCHRLSRLAPKTRYSITVRARNAEVEEDGDADTVTAITVEDGAPGAPEDLQLVSRSNSSLSVQWRLPQLFGGIIRSYVLSVEQTDAADSAGCCQYFPLQELAVRSELPLYSHQFSNLSSASKYTVSVSWKTVALGPSSSLQAATRPDAPAMDENIHYDEEEDSIVLEGLSTEDNLLKGYLVLIRPENTSDHIPVTTIKSSDLAEEISRNINGTFYVVAELLPGELENSVVVELGRSSADEDERSDSLEDLDDKGGVFCQVKNPSLPDGSYRAVLVKIREYSSAHSVSWVETSSFTKETGQSDWWEY